MRLPPTSSWADVNLIDIFRLYYLAMKNGLKMLLFNWIVRTRRYTSLKGVPLSIKVHQIDSRKLTESVYAFIFFEFDSITVFKSA